MLAYRTIIFSFVIFSFSIQANDSVNERVVAMKAAYLYRFSLFIDWPEPILDEFLICIADNNAYHHLMQFNLYNQYIKDQPIRVISVTEKEDLSGCQLLYLPNNIQNSTVFLAKVSHGTLTLGENIDFYRAQGMIYLYVRENKLQFFINHQVLKDAGLKIRAKLMALSRLPVKE